MQLTVGAFTYNVRRRWNLTDGDAANPVALNGLTIFHKREIWIDGDVLGDAAMEVLRHEFSEAFAYHCPPCGEHESRRQFESTVGAAFDEQFRSQGGLAAFESLPIEGLRPTAASRPIEASYKITDTIVCPSCEAPVVTALSTTGPAEMNDAGVFLVRRWIRCECCDSIIVWTERSTPTGFPLGEYFSAEILRGLKAAEFVARMTGELASA